MIVSTEIFTGAFRSLSIYELALLLYLAVETNQKTGQCHSSHKTIMNDLTIKVNTLRDRGFEKRLKTLESVIFIKRGFKNAAFY
jgi:hypothetical protein